MITGGLTFGGSTTLLCNLGGEFVRQEVPVVVLSLEKENAFARDFESLGVPVIVQDDQREVFEDRVRHTLEALAEFQPTAVVACVGAASFEILRYVPEGVRRGGMVQTDHVDCYDAASPYAASLDVMIGVSEHIRETLEAKPEFKHAAIHCMTSGVLVPQTFTPRRLGPGDPLRILYLGRLDRGQKRVHLFPEILSGLVQSGIPFTWTIVGEGAEKGFLEQNMKTARADQQVRVAGKVAYEKVPDLLAKNDVFLLASEAEGLPLTLLEAMAQGTVPVVSDLPSGIRELLDDNCGRLVRPENIAGYAEAIAWLYQHPEDWRRLSLNAHEKMVRNYSTRAMAERWLAAFPPGDAGIKWPERWTVRPPLDHKNTLYFSPAARVFRRIALRLRTRLTALRKRKAA